MTVAAEQTIFRVMGIPHEPAGSGPIPPGLHDMERGGWYEGIIVAKVFSICDCRFCMRTLNAQMSYSKFEDVDIYFACVLKSHKCLTVHLKS